MENTARSNNNKITIASVVVLVIALIAIIVMAIANLNTPQTLKCSSLINNMEIEFDGKRPKYVSGIIDAGDIDDIEMVKERIPVYSSTISLNKEEKKITYAFSYDEVNQAELEFVGLGYDKNSNYGTIKKDLETNNYYCE